VELRRITGIHLREMLLRKYVRISRPIADISLLNILKQAAVGRDTGHTFNNILNKVFYTSFGCSNRIYLGNRHFNLNGLCKKWDVIFNLGLMLRYSSIFAQVVSKFCYLMWPYKGRTMWRLITNVELCTTICVSLALTDWMEKGVHERKEVN
jgi:hypothetical protein